MNLISTHDFNFHPLCVRRNTTLIFLVNSQMKRSHVIQTQAQKCDGMRINFDAVYQGDSKFARETSKTKTALIGSIFSDDRTRHFDALTHNLFFCAYSGLSKYIKNTLN